MLTLDSAREFLTYNDWANRELLQAAGPLPDEALDRPFDMGVGALRRTLIHIYNGETVWLERWRGRVETPWPTEDERLAVETLACRFVALTAVRDDYLGRLRDADLAESVTYRDSKGGLFRATRGAMLMQALVHSAHHRAQAVNMLRRVGGALVELDYMMHVRQPA